MAFSTSPFAASAVAYGRSGYNKDDSEDKPVNKGRDGYNKDGEVEVKKPVNKGRDGYN